MSADEPPPDEPTNLRDGIRKRVTETRLLVSDALRKVDLAVDVTLGRVERSGARIPLVSKSLGEAKKSLDRAARLVAMTQVDAERAEEAGVDFATAETIELETLTASGSLMAAKERLELVLSVAKELEERPDQSFSIEELAAGAERLGLAPRLADEAFHSLRNQGEVMEIKKGRWKLVRF